MSAPIAALLTLLKDLLIARGQRQPGVHVTNASEDAAGPDLA
jgi:hypothetical protein